MNYFYLILNPELIKFRFLFLTLLKKIPMKYNLLLVNVLFLTFSACAQKDTTIEASTYTYSVETVVDDLQIPWGMASHTIGNRMDQIFSIYSCGVD